MNPLYIMELLQYIMNYLPKNDVKKCRSVCQLWKKIIDQYLTSDKIRSSQALERFALNVLRRYPSNLMIAGSAALHMYMRSKRQAHSWLPENYDLFYVCIVDYENTVAVEYSPDDWKHVAHNPFKMHEITKAACFMQPPLCTTWRFSGYGKVRLINNVLPAGWGPEQLINLFDFNKSRIAYYNGRFIFGRDFDADPFIEMDSTSENLARIGMLRYKKYTSRGFDVKIKEAGPDYESRSMMHQKHKYCCKDFLFVEELI